jgi:AraC-like DNA-binding protein
MSGEEKIDFMIRWMGGMETETDKLKEIPQAAFIIAVNVFYSILATYEVIKNFKKPNATMEQKFLNQWLFSFLSVALVILATFLAAAVSVSLFGVNVYVFFRAAPILVAIFGIVLAVKGLSYPDLICEPETANRTRKYKTLTLSESRTKKYYSSILRLMVEDKEYLNPDLNIQFFVEKLGIPRAYISFLINQVTGRKFNDFVNDFRFDHAKNLLSVCKDQPQKIIDIAFESGFNSKSTFYSYFKKKAGLSPQEFLEKYDGKTIH